MKSPSLSLLLLSGAVLSTTSQAFIAILPPWGADAGGRIADRFGQSGSVAGAGNPSETGNSGDFHDGGGVASNTATGSDVRGQFDSHAQLLGSFSNFMEIGTKAQTPNTLDGNSAVEAYGRAADTFTYNGGAATTFTVTINLSGSLTNTLNDPSPLAGNYGSVGLILGDFDNVGDWDTLVGCGGECWDWDQYAFDPFDNIIASVVQTDGTSILTDSITFDVNPGDSFILYGNAYSQIWGQNAEADALNTVTVGFTDGPTGDLTRGFVAVPEPASLAFLLGLGSTLLMGMRRRR